VNRKRFGAESNLIYRNELNRPAKGVHTGGRAGGAARKEVTLQTHGKDKYKRTLDPAGWNERQSGTREARVVLVVSEVCPGDTVLEG
jgi:hypothetical protein